jgi:hypothetical protein
MVVDSRFRLPSGGCLFDRLYGHEYPYFMYATNNRAGNYEKEGKYKRNVTEMFEDNKMVTKDRHYKAKKTSIYKQYREN